jgi:hypothetical protein
MRPIAVVSTSSGRGLKAKGHRFMHNSMKPTMMVTMMATVNKVRYP